MSYVQQADPTNVMGRRIGAFAIDMVLLWGIAIGMFAALADITTYEDAGILGIDCDSIDDDYFCYENDDNGDITVFEAAGTVTAAIVSVGVWLGNFVVLQGLTGGSVGKLLVGLRVVDGTGRRAGFGRVLVRSLFLIVDGFACYLVGLITSLVSKGHRRVGDMVAKTYVVKAVDMNRAPIDTGAMQPSGPGWTPPPTPGWTPPGTPGAAPAPSPETPGWGAPQPPPPAPGTPPGWAEPPTKPPEGWGTSPPPPPPESQ